MAKRRLVPTSTIREWAATPEGAKALAAADAPTPGPRGRVNPATVTVFKKANPNLDYAEKVSEGKRITVPVPARDARGRNITRKVTLPMSEFRSLAADLGVAKATGRFSQDAVAHVGAALIEG